MKRFEDTAVVVSGAGSGIGRATAQRLAEEGARVACLDVNQQALEDTASKLGASARAFVCDIADPRQVEAAVGAAADALGGVQVLCNVAGILRTDHTHELALEDWERVLRINLTGTFLMCKAALPHLLANKRSAIVNTSSTAALGSHPWMAAYAASKGGIMSLTRCLAIEYVKRGLRANCIVPGGIATPLHSQFAVPAKAEPELIRGAVPFVPYVGPEHAASVIAFLASDDARYMNGTEVRVDGGALS
jgi:NAD(P)-dependent dehydrogenase (short-subunit alcohol dehydrogenase family)